MSKKVEFGDFQTPLDLAKMCTNLLKKIVQPDVVIEPTCGLGYFIEAANNTWSTDAEYFGYEINKEYIDSFKKRCPELFRKATVKHADFFSLDLNQVCSVGKKPLVIGNPPWVTNSQLGVLNSKNLPKKSNVKELSGFEALSGKSNFDISEWMIMSLSRELNQKKGVLAMLCKTSVARNIFIHNYKSGIENVAYKIFKIDSKKEFDVSVDACLFLIDFSTDGDSLRCDIYSDLDNETFESSIGISSNKIIADINLHDSTREWVQGKSDIIWRSGIKHDASKVMELRKEGNELKNGFDETVSIEEDLVYPLLKSSNLANERLKTNKFVIVTQKKVGEDTSHIKENYPKLWRYLNNHKDKLDGRKSSIYKKQPRFSIFGIGDYSFKPYKLAIAGLYKNINFCLIEPIDGKPVMMDDTCYLLGFNKKKEAVKYLKTLRSSLVTDYISSLIFWDSKRPINSEILKSIDLDLATSNFSSYEGPEPQAEL